MTKLWCIAPDHNLLPLLHQGIAFSASMSVKSRHFNVEALESFLIKVSINLSKTLCNCHESDKGSGLEKAIRFFLQFLNFDLPQSAALRT